MLGPWFLPATFIAILPAAIYALYLIGREGRVTSFSTQYIDKTGEALLELQMKILFLPTLMEILLKRLCFIMIL